VEFGLINRKKVEKMKLTNYVDAMEFWKGRVDSTEDYDAFRWHQWVQPLDLNSDLSNFECEHGFAFIGFCSEQGVKRNRGRVGTALAPDFIRKQMSNLPCTFDSKVKLYDAGNILCDEISMEEGQKLLGLAVEKILSLGLFPIVLGGGHETTYGHFQGQLKDVYLVLYL
jgi:formiminoglutamase